MTNTENNTDDILIVKTIEIEIKMSFKTSTRRENYHGNLEDGFFTYFH